MILLLGNFWGTYCSKKQVLAVQQKEALTIVIGLFFIRYKKTKHLCMSEIWWLQLLSCLLKNEAEWLLD